MSDNLKIDPLFRDLLPALTREEYAALEGSIRAEGCRDAIVTWNGCIVDGHNRYEICKAADVEFKTVAMEFDSDEAACDWIDRNQAGRRNLTAEQIKLALGRIYNRTKKAEHDGGQGKQRSGDQIEPSLRTAEKLAVEHHVSPATVKRAGKFAEQVEADPELKQAVREGKSAKAIIQERKAAEGEAATVDKKQEHQEVKGKKLVIGPPCVGMQFARLAIMKLEEIKKNDAERKAAFEKVRTWIDENE